MRDLFEELVVILVIVLIIAAVVGVAIGGNSAYCRHWDEANPNYETEFWILGGCMVRLEDGTLIELANFRGISDGY